MYYWNKKGGGTWSTFNIVDFVPPVAVSTELITLKIIASICKCAIVFTDEIWHILQKRETSHEKGFTWFCVNGIAFVMVFNHSYDVVASKYMIYHGQSNDVTNIKWFDVVQYTAKKVNCNM